MNYWNNAFANINFNEVDFSKSRPEAALLGFSKTYLSNNDPVLDLGCGGGRNAQFLAEAGYSVYGVDVASSAVAFCRKRFEKLRLTGHFEEGSFDRIPFENAYFSAVICVAALDHVTLSTAQKSVQEIRRVMRPGAAALFTFDPPDMDEDMLDEAEVLPDRTLRFIKGSQAGMLFRRYTDEEIKEVFSSGKVASFEYSPAGSRIVTVLW